MIAWDSFRRFGNGMATVSLVLLTAASSIGSPVWLAPTAPPARWEAASEPVSARKAADTTPATPAQLRARAAAAERAGDWELAFAAYCELYAVDRSDPAVRDKLNASLRRVQQVRRHRDPTFRQYVAYLSVGDAANLFAELTVKVPVVFADPTRSTPQQLWTSGVEELERALSDPTFRSVFLDSPTPKQVDAFRISLRNVWAKRVVGDARDARTGLKQLIAAAQDALVVRVPAALAIEVVCGACSGLDEYTVFLTPAQAVEATNPVADLAAHGLTLDFSDGGLTVEVVAPGSWAALHTPLQKGDRIARLNGRSMHDVGPDAIAESLTTPIGDFHEIELLPPSPDMLPPLVRLPVEIPTVYGGRIVSSKDGIGYVRINEFQPTTPRELTDAVASLRLEGMRVLVLDLRGNHGGSFLAGVEVARRFLPAGLVVSTQGQLGQVAGQVFSSDSGTAAIDVPLVVLIDTETASAAEVVAAALRDNNRAVLVGMPTFGKGTIQYPLKLSGGDEPDRVSPTRSRSGTVRITIARLISPRGTPINGPGITPHIIEPDPVRQVDLAIDRALDLLHPMIGPPSPLPLPPGQ